MHLILASQSPRRAELLRSAGIPFFVRALPVDEARLGAENPAAYVERLAKAKAEAALSGPEDSVLAADTVVVVDGVVFGKPRDHADARRMLGILSGRKHSVLTAVCLISSGDVAQETASTDVWFAPLSASEIAWYAATEEPADKAGAYAIQGMAARYIERIDGSYSNVVGLPLAVVYRLLRRAKLSW